ncbi:MAG: HAD family phosphatase [Deltaproteobacteria bacterium]|nr:HAD family phosphatase [Deltaproteobacteria bacterium]
MNVDAVLFDFGGVLAEEGFREGLTEVARANGLDPVAFVQTAVDTVYATGYLLGKAPESRFWDALRQKTGIKESDDALREAVFSRFIPRDWMLDLVKKLKGRGLTVGILSDQLDMLDQLDKKYDFFRWFDDVFNSYHLGKGKRDPSHFADVARVLKTKPERLLFIDDDQGNIARARQMGWQAILYTDRESFLKALEAIVPLT